MNTTQRELSDFEQRLLDELRRTIVADRRTPVSPRVTRRRRVTLAGGIAVVGAAALSVGLPFVDRGSGPAPVGAYAVTANNDGTVRVEISALRDAEGLERRLREAGVPAVVRSVPPGDACASENTFALIRPASPRAGAIDLSDDGSVRFEIDKDALRPGEKVFIYTGPAGTIAVSIVDEKIAGCSG